MQRLSLKIPADTYGQVATLLKYSIAVGVGHQLQARPLSLCSRDWDKNATDPFI